MTHVPEPTRSIGGDADGPVAPAWRSPLAWVILIAALALGLGADLISKSTAFQRVAGEPVVLIREVIVEDARWMPPHHEAVQIIPYVLDFKLVLNHGAVFGIGPGQRWFFIAFTILAITAGGIIFAFRTTTRDHITHLAIGLVLAGAAGNLYDRWTYGAVRDFLNLFPRVHLPFDWTWPGGNPELFPWVFNLADTLLLIGIGLLIVRIGFEERSRREEGLEDSPTPVEPGPELATSEPRSPSTREDG